MAPTIGPSGERAVSVKDVAARAGVSWKTVSNVVNRRDNVSDATRSKVQQAIDELGYRPNLAGRQLRQGRSRTLMLAVPDIAAPYFGELAASIITAARQRGYTVLVESTEGTAASEAEVVQGRHLPMVDGVILSPIDIGERELREALDDRPLVLLGERLYGTGFTHVAIDNAGSAREVAHHLMVRGRRRFAFIGTNPRSGVSTSTVRLSGLRGALEANGVPLPREAVVDTPDYSRESGVRATERLLHHGYHPDAIVCANDLLAVGALHALREAGLRVPDDVAVTGWDDVPESSYTVPPLTTIAPDIQTLASTAVAHLVALIEGEAAPTTECVTPHRLISRGTSAITPPNF